MIDPLAITLSEPLSVLAAAYEFFAATSLVSLVFLAVVLHYAGQLGSAYDSQSIHAARARQMGLLSFLAFCLYGYITTTPAESEAAHYLALGFRAFLALVIVDGVAALILPIVARLGWNVAAYGRSLRRDFDRMRQRRLLASQTAPTIALPPAPPPDPADLLRSGVDQAKREYDAACESLRSAGLDADELDEALLFTKQKYVRRIRELTKP